MDLHKDLDPNACGVHTWVCLCKVYKAHLAGKCAQWQVWGDMDQPLRDFEGGDGFFVSHNLAIKKYFIL